MPRLRPSTIAATRELTAASGKRLVGSSSVPAICPLLSEVRAAARTVSASIRQQCLAMLCFVDGIEPPSSPADGRRDLRRFEMYLLRRDALTGKGQ